MSMDSTMTSIVKAGFQVVVSVEVCLSKDDNFTAKAMHSGKTVAVGAGEYAHQAVANLAQALIYLSLPKVAGVASVDDNLAKAFS